MDITNAEYEEPRSNFQLCEWINNKLRDLESTPDFQERYSERRGLNIKKLLEEAVPVARLGLYLWRPWRDVSVTCLARDQPHDAEITVKEPNKTETIKIEVTCTETDDTTMRRQALSRQGFVWMGGPVRREGRQIVSEATMVDLDNASGRLVECALARFRGKAEREDDPQTAILVYLVRSFPSLSLRYRTQLLEQTRTYLRAHRPTLYGAYYCYEADDADQGFDDIRNEPHNLVM
jgi:hypothetical protein